MVGKFVHLKEIKICDKIWHQTYWLVFDPIFFCKITYIVGSTCNNLKILFQVLSFLGFGGLKFFPLKSFFIKCSYNENSYNNCTCLKKRNCNIFLHKNICFTDFLNETLPLLLLSIFCCYGKNAEMYRYRTGIEQWMDISYFYTKHVELQLDGSNVIQMHTESHIY